MGRKRRKLIFCTECGNENSRLVKKCVKCDNLLNIKDHLIIDYIKEKFIDDAKDNLISKVLSFIKNIIFNNFYGSILIATIIFTTSIVLNVTNNPVNYNIVQNKPVLINSCNKTKAAILTCDDSYTLIENICIKTSKSNAKLNYSCDNNYFLDGNYCISNKNYDVLTKEECLKPSTLPSFMDSWDQFVKVEETADGLCGIHYCTGKDANGNWDCSAGTADEIPLTTVSYCASGQTLINGKCKIKKKGTKNYSCENGTLDNKKCVIEESTDPIIVCEDGYEYDDTCQACKEV